jgi:hypothetical protein
LIHRAKEDATRGTLLGIARELLVIAKHIDVATDKAISIDDLEAPSSVCSRRKPLWIGIAFAQKRRRP